MRVLSNAVLMLLVLLVSSASSQSLQTALDNLGYSINVVRDRLTGDFFFQQHQGDAVVIFREASLAPTTAMGYYTSSSQGDWLVGGESTGLPLSTEMPTIEDVFGFKLRTNYIGDGTQNATWYSDASQNGGDDHLWVFPTIIGGEVVPYSYILAWEDLPGTGDGDFQDMVVRVEGIEVSTEGIEPVPTEDQLVNLVQWREEDGGNGHWYAILATLTYWEEANNAASAVDIDGESGHLAVITSPEENDFIFNTVVDGVSSPSILDEFFLGGMWTGSGWAWVTGEPFAYSNWSVGQPSGAESAVAMWGIGEPSSGQWNDEDTDRFVFWSIVEWGIDEVQVPSYNLVNLSQWRSEDGGNNHWYGILALPCLWNSARSIAGELIQDNTAGHLATITSQAENDFIYNTVTEGVVSPSIIDEYFLGGIWDGTQWEWITGESMQYINWGPGEPSAGEPAIALWGREGAYPGYWNNEDASRFFFWSIVEWDVTTQSPSPVAVSGRVSSNGQGLAGIRVDLAASDGSCVSSAVSDGVGLYSMPIPAGGEYTVLFDVPIGYNPIGDAVVEIVVSGLDLTVDMDLQQTASYDSWRLSLYYWKQQVQYLHDGTYPWRVEMTVEQIDGYLDDIFNHFDQRFDSYAIQVPDVTYAGEPAQPMTFDDLYNVFFEEVYDGSYPAKARRGLVTVLLDIAAGFLPQQKPVSADGVTASQAVIYLAGLILSGDDADAQFAYENLKLIWSGNLIPDHALPLSTPNIVFKPSGDNDDSLPSLCSLSQNYPNPFNPSTEIAFDLAEASGVRLEVYNAIGQRVAVLVDETLPAGRHVVTWDATSFASGVYFSRLATGTVQASQKMVLLK